MSVHNRVQQPRHHKNNDNPAMISSSSSSTGSGASSSSSSSSSSISNNNKSATSHRYHGCRRRPSSNRRGFSLSSSSSSSSSSSTISLSQTLTVRLIMILLIPLLVMVLIINHHVVIVRNDNHHHHRNYHRSDTTVTTTTTTTTTKNDDRGQQQQQQQQQQQHQQQQQQQEHPHQQPARSSSSSSSSLVRVTSSSILLHTTTDTPQNKSSENDRLHRQSVRSETHQQQHQQTESFKASSWSSPSSFLHLWTDGCYNTTTKTSKTESSSSSSPSSSSSSSIPRGDRKQPPADYEQDDDEHLTTPPTGIVVTLLAATDDQRVNIETFRRICKVLPTQIDYFVEPQGNLDMLLVIEEDGKQRWTVDAFVSCLRLTPLILNVSSSNDNDSNDNDSNDNERTWKNLDGTTMAATPYRYESYSKLASSSSSSSSSLPSSASCTIFIAVVRLQHPMYIRSNPSILQQPIVPPSCDAPRQYIQATRWYTREMLHLGILRDYDYFFKIDTDVIFIDTIPFNLLYDMDRRGSGHGDGNGSDIVFAHTAQYHPKGSKTCAQGIKNAVDQYIEEAIRYHRQHNASASTWNGKRCSESPELMSDVDWYYTNFVVGKVDFWQSREVLDFVNFLSEYPEGFYKYRWTDQIVWHHAMGLFLRDYEKHVMGYTDLRCMPDPNCWYSSYNLNKYGADAWHRCDNDGFFLHPKNYYLPATLKKKQPLERLTLNVSQPLFRSTYGSDCSASQPKQTK